MALDGEPEDSAELEGRCSYGDGMWEQLERLPQTSGRVRGALWRSGRLTMPRFQIWDQFSLFLLTGHVRFIDYEYAGYNYQAFDIGNHFNEFAGRGIALTSVPCL